MVTMSDVLRVPKEKAEATQVKNIMTQNVVFVDPKQSLYEALHKMNTNGIGRLPVIDQSSGKLLGIISRTDIFKAYDKYVSDKALVDDRDRSS
jgi:CBS domain-containing protein